MNDFVGWREWVALPDLGIEKLKCKVDTGAKNSAIHAFKIEEFQKNNELWVRFAMHLKQTDDTAVQYCEAKVVDQRAVTDSGGNITERYFIETTIKLGQKTIQGSLSLTSRDTMKFKMLLGRTALRKFQFSVNSAHSYIQGKPS